MIVLQQYLGSLSILLYPVMQEVLKSFGEKKKKVLKHQFENTPSPVFKSYSGKSTEHVLKISKVKVH